VLGPLSSRFQPACCLLLFFPHLPLPFLRYLSVPRSLLAAYFTRRHLVKYFTLSDGWYLDSCWSGCRVAHPPSQLTSNHLIHARATLRTVRPSGRSPKLHQLCNLCIHSLSSHYECRHESKHKDDRIAMYMVENRNTKLKVIRV